MNNWLHAMRLNMLYPRKPSSATLRRFLDQQADHGFSYTAVGATDGPTPPGYVVDHTRIRLGEGKPVYDLAIAALRNWSQFDLGWVQAWPRDTPIEPGQVVSVMGRAIGFWWLNACKIVYVIDEPGPLNRFGFAYGTLPAHVERGEERFVIEWDERTGTVTYDILAFSRPNHLFIRLGYPVVRLTQKRFARESGAAMLRAVRTSAKK